VSIITLKSPFASYRGATSFPHADGQVVYPVGDRHFSRAFVHPDNPKSSLQVTLRAYMTAISQAWQSVSDANALGWATLGAAMSPVVDEDGLEYDIGAQQAYTKVNMYLLLDGQAQDPVAPAYSLPAAPGIDTATYTSGTTTLAFVFDANVAQTGFVMVEISPQTYSARRTARHNEVRLPNVDPAISIIALTSADPGFDLPCATNRFAIAATERRGFKLTYLDANYVPGQNDFETLTIAAP